MDALLDPRFAAAIGLMVLLAISPGPDVALVTTTSLARGRAAVAWLTLLAVVVDRAGDILRRPRLRRAVAALTGAVLVGFGLRVAVDRG